MSILSRVAQDMEAAVGLRQTASSVPSLQTAPATNNPGAGVLPTQGQQGPPPALIPAMAQQAQRLNPNLHLPSFLQGVQAGHAAATQPGDLTVRPVMNQPQFPHPQTTAGPPAGGYQHLNPTVIPNYY